MKSYKFALVALALPLFAVSALAQQPGAAAPQKPPAPALLPKGKVAVVNTAAFQDQVQEFKQAVSADYKNAIAETDPCRDLRIFKHRNVSVNFPPAFFITQGCSNRCIVNVKQ